MREILKGELNLFDNKDALNSGDLIFALESVSTYLIDFEEYEKVLPVATLMEYVSSDICYSHESLIKSRIFKGIALAELGYIDQSM